MHLINRIKSSFNDLFRLFYRILHAPHIDTKHSHKEAKLMIRVLYKNVIVSLNHSKKKEEEKEEEKKLNGPASQPATQQNRKEKKKRKPFQSSTEQRTENP